nr:hypothetical protein BCU37_16815 [Vibrio splendidus]PMK15591.1 hypothetical protein BCU10_14405 [Vibrio splendidus]PMK61438.1 hypothetical protein BCT96_00785 [Vibrio splendidus]|tara:strand:+ start:4466 stop:4792 length:327 start_codon:yes stop_codon:yes gene_type:complete
MKHYPYHKTVLVAVLFIFYHLDGFASDLKSVQCLIENQNIILTFDNDMMSSFQLSTKTDSKFSQNTNSGTTKLILNINQFPAVINLSPANKAWTITSTCTIKPFRQKE